MIPAVRLGAKVFRMELEQFLLSPAAVPLKSGSEWCELLLQANLRDPERWGEPPHGHPRHWDWGCTLRSVIQAMQRYDHLQRIARNLTPEQEAVLWTDASPAAAELRQVIALDRGGARRAG